MFDQTGQQPAIGMSIETDLNKTNKSTWRLQNQMPSLDGTSLEAPSIIHQTKVQPEKRLSPLLDKEEKAGAWNLGQSLDSKKITSALGYLDLKQICYCLAQGLNKHIQFSKGNFFLDDLKNQEKNLPDLEFSYNLGKGKIDLDAIKLKKEQKKEESKKQFEELKMQMENENKVSETPKNLTNHKQDLLLKEDSPDNIVDESKDIEDFYDEKGIDD